MTLTATPARLIGLDTLRAAAVLVVVLYHLTIFGELPSSLLSITWFGWMGVDLFFVLSGFLIGHQLLKPYLRDGRFSVVDFYRRRAFRILPTYLVVLSLYFLVPRWNEAISLAPLWKFLTFTMNLGFSFDRRGFSQAWSLCVEEHFYLLFPLLVLILMRRPSARRTIATIMSFVLLGVALRAFLITHYPDDVWGLIYYPSYSRLDGLVTGVTLATIRNFRPRWWNWLLKRGHTLFLLGVCCIACVVWMFRKHDLGESTGSAMYGMIGGLPLLSFGFGLITISSVSDNGLLAKIRIPGTKGLAALAFALYLTHKEVAHLVMQGLPAVTSLQGPEAWLLYAISCVAVAWLLHVAIEVPFLRLRDRRPAHASISTPEAEARNDPAL